MILRSLNDNFGVLLAYLSFQVKEAVARARGDLHQAERIAAEDKLVINLVDVDTDATSSTTSATSKGINKRKRMEEDDEVLQAMEQKLTAAQTEIKTVREAIATAEPVTERTTFLDWVRAVCKNANDDQWAEFQAAFIAMQGRWKASDRLQKQQQQQFPGQHQWRMLPPHMTDSSVWGTQSPESTLHSTQQPYLPQRQPNYMQYRQQQQQFAAEQQQWPASAAAVVPVGQPPSSTPKTSIAEVVNTAFLCLNDSQASLDFSGGSLGIGLSTSTQEVLNEAEAKLNTPPSKAPSQDKDMTKDRNKE